MTFQADTLRRSQRRLLDAAEALCLTACEVNRLTRAARDERLAATLRMLRDVVLPLLERDELEFYPEVAARFDDSLASASIAVDKAAIADYVDRLAAASVDDGDQLERFLYGLAALLEAFAAKEERLFGPALERARWPARL